MRPFGRLATLLLLIFGLSAPALAQSPPPFHDVGDRAAIQNGSAPTLIDEDPIDYLFDYAHAFSKDRDGQNDDNEEVRVIRGKVFYDQNRNGLDDPGEQVVEGAVVRIYVSYWGAAAEELTGRLAKPGRYVFPMQRGKTYELCLMVPGGWIQTYPLEGQPGVVLNQGPHNPRTSGSPDEWTHCWEVQNARGGEQRHFGMYQYPGE